LNGDDILSDQGLDMGYFTTKFTLLRLSYRPRRVLLHGPNCYGVYIY